MGRARCLDNLELPPRDGAEVDVANAEARLFDMSNMNQTEWFQFLLETSKRLKDQRKVLASPGLLLDVASGAILIASALRPVRAAQASAVHSIEVPDVPAQQVIHGLHGMEEERGREGGGGSQRTAHTDEHT